MFVALSKVVKARSAAILAAFYLLCVLAPTAGFALGDSVRTTHCLADAAHQLEAFADNYPGGATKVHVHEHGTAHKSSGNSDGHTDGKQCCGLICLTALPAMHHELQGPRVPIGIARATTIEHLADRAPDRLYRPPISLLFV